MQNLLGIFAVTRPQVSGVPNAACTVTPQLARQCSTLGGSLPPSLHSATVLLPSPTDLRHFLIRVFTATW